MAGNVKTAEVMRKILTAKTVTKMLRELEKNPAPTIAQYLDELRIENGLKKEEFFVLGGVSTVFGYEILRGAKYPSRDTLIQFAFAFKMSVERTQEMLRIGEKAELYPRLKRDALIIHGLENGISVVEHNIKAEEKGILPIGNY